MIDLAQLKVICPRTPDGVLLSFVVPLNEAMDECEAGDPKRAAPFVAQWAHETAGFTKLEENLFYSADRLMAVWPKRFPTLEAAQACARNPEALGNTVYANRMGNGDAASGDGYRYRGRGLPHLTGRDNYTRFARASGLGVVAQPELLIEPGPAARAAAWFWKTNDCNGFCDRGDMRGLRRTINGGYNGLDETIVLASRLMESMA